MKEVEVKGYNLDRFLDELLRCGIMPKKIRRVEHDELLLEISDKDYKNLLVKKFASCYNVNVVSSKSRVSALFAFLKRLGLVAGLAVSIFIMAISSNSITNITISVSGNNKEQLKDIAQQVLVENNIVAGGKLEKSFKDIENLLLSELDNSASVLVKRKGNELIVDIREIVQEPEPEHKNIVSLFDGKITAINHTSGNLKVNIGEGVVKGQVLIESGYIGDFFTEAKGEIIAKVIISGSAVGSTKQTSVKRTGQVTTLKGFEILNKTIALDNNGSFDGIYASYELEKEEVYLSKNMVFPIKLVKYNLYELETIEIEVEEDKAIEELKDKAYTIAKDSLPDNAKVGNITFDVYNDNGYLKVVCNINTEISIGERK